MSENLTLYSNQDARRTSDSQTRTIFLTGATGLLGKTVLAMLCSQSSVKRIFVLMRPKNGHSGQRRLHDLIKNVFSPSRREQVHKKITVLNGDLSKQIMGLSNDVVVDLVDQVSEIVHLAGSSNSHENSEYLKSVNIDGFRRVLDLAKKIQSTGSLKRFDWMSSVYVKSPEDGAVTEDSKLCAIGRVPPGFLRGKWECEQILAKEGKDLPVTIYRPSTIVGNSQSGYVSHFKSFYWLLRQITQEQWKILPASRKSRFDFVPVDYVARAMVLAMSRSDSIGRSFHLTGGEGNEVTFSDLLSDARSLGKVPKTFLIPHRVYNFVFGNRLVRMLAPRLIYRSKAVGSCELLQVEGGAYFRSSNTDEYFSSKSLCRPHWNDYKREVFEFCRLSQWGFRSVMPEYAYYLPVSTSGSQWLSSMTN